VRPVGGLFRVVSAPAGCLLMAGISLLAHGGGGLYWFVPAAPWVISSEVIAPPGRVAAGQPATLVNAAARGGGGWAEGS
jgi:hypothetical protein